MGCYIDQLYGDNWQSKRRGLSSPWCLFTCTRKCVDNIYGQACCLSADVVNVSLQWLVFSGHYRLLQEHIFACDRSVTNRSEFCKAQRNSSMRCPNCHVIDHCRQRQRETQTGLWLNFYRCRAATATGACRYETGWF